MKASKRDSGGCSLLVAMLTLVLAGLSACSSPSLVRGGAGRDGPPVEAGPDPLTLPDLELKIEPIRVGGPNKPYEIFGQTYVPLTRDLPLAEQGLASWYGRKFHGRRTASGELFNMYALTAAHRTMPIPSFARVRNPLNGREVIVRINDRGPFSSGRAIDLSWAAAVKLGVQNAVSPVEIYRLTHEDIRGAQAEAVAAAAPPAGETAQTTRPDESWVSPAAEPASAVQPLPAKAFTTVGVGFWLQLGAFSQADRAMAFRMKVAAEADWLEPMLAVFNEGGVSRLQAGPYVSREAAASAAVRVRGALNVSPVLVERR